MSKPSFDLDPAENAVEATVRVCRTLHAVVEANEPGVRADRDPECLHDFRVALRRTRSALSQMKGVFDPARSDPFERGFRRLGRETGPQRDADVLLQALPAIERELGPGVELAPLAAVLRERRRRAHARTLAVLAEEDYGGLMGRWSAFLDGPHPESDRAPNARRPVRPVASERIARAYRRVLRKGDGLAATSPPAAFHELRIACKKLRYLVTFFRGLYPPDQVAGIVPELKTLQDALGTYNDCEVQRGIVGEAAERLASSGAGAAALSAAERVREHLGARQDDVRERFAAWFAVFSGAGERRRFDVVFSPDGGA